MSWPDIVIGAIVVIGTFKGFKTGFVSELTGIIALLTAITAGFTYTGFWDETISHAMHVGPGSSHTIGLIAFDAEVYLVVTVIGFFLGRIAMLPIVSSGNALLGAGIGFIKAATLVWAILYVALFFPLPHDLRHDLHRSAFVVVLTEPNEQVDDKLRNALPDFARLFTIPLFARHRV